MTHRIALPFVLASLLFLAPRPVDAATFTASYDTIVGIELNGDNITRNIVITGIRTGSTSVTTTTFSLETDQPMITECQTFAVTMMSNPGVFRLSIGPHFKNVNFGGGCKLTLQ